MAVLPNFTLTKHNMTEYIQKYEVLQTLHFSISDRSIFSWRIKYNHWS